MVAPVDMIPKMTPVKMVWRVFRILRILARHGVLKPFVQGFTGQGAMGKLLWAFSLLFGQKPPSNIGQGLVKALQELGPVYVKLGQSLAVRPDMVGDDVANALRTLQDDLPPFDGDKAIVIIEQQLGKSIGDMFAQFDKTPVAAASIAQVHKAQTHDGQWVAVKVLRPNVIDQFQKEIAFFYAVAHQLMAQGENPEIERLNPIQVVDTFASWVRLETDFSMEAAAASEFAKNTAHDPHFQVPSVHWDLTRDKVLTLDWVDGVRIDDVQGLQDMGVDRDHVMTVASRQFLQQIFEYGFFHGDMHPGNMIVRADGVLCPVDFGIMGRLDWDTRYFLADTLYGFLNQDYELVAKAHFDYGVFGGTQDQQLFKQALASVGEPYKDKPMSHMNIAHLLGRLFKITRDFNMQVQPQLLLMQKTLLVAEGVGRVLNDRVNMWALSQDLITDWMKKHRGVQGRIKHKGGKVLESLQAMPITVNRLQTCVDDMAERGLSLSPETVQALSQNQKQNRWIRSFVWGILGIGVGLVLGHETSYIQGFLNGLYGSFGG